MGVKEPGRMIGKMVWEGRYECLVKEFGDVEGRWEKENKWEKIGEDCEFNELWGTTGHEQKVVMGPRLFFIFIFFYFFLFRKDYLKRRDVVSRMREAMMR